MVKFVSYCYYTQQGRQNKGGQPQNKIVNVEEQELEHVPSKPEVVFLHPCANGETIWLFMSEAHKVRLFTYPVIMRKTPTPPIHPIKICRGKKPMRTPSLSAPKMKKVNPVVDFNDVNNHKE